MTYAELKKLTEGKELPLAATNESGENVIIGHRTDIWTYEETTWNRNYFETITAQHNGWTRHSFYYEDGSYLSRITHRKVEVTRHPNPYKVPRLYFMY